jgi:hypothetical protein
MSYIPRKVLSEVSRKVYSKVLSEVSREVLSKVSRDIFRGGFSNTIWVLKYLKYFVCRISHYFFRDFIFYFFIQILF